MSFKVATMCSGIGSPEQSLRELGIPHENIFACEKDKFARQTYLANFNPSTMYEDMTIEKWDLPEQYADVIVAGIPCQSFSLAGKRQGENDPRGLLIYDFIRYVKNQRPKVFIIENVKGLLSDQGGVTFSKWLDLLGCSRNNQPNMFTNSETCGYNLHYRVLNCKHYGLPQNRERIFIIGIRPDISSAFTWPRKVILRDRLIDLLEAVVDEKYYLSDTALKYIVNDSGNWSDRLSMMDSSNAMISGDSTANHSKGVPYNMIEVANKINNKNGYTKFGTSQDQKLSPLNGISQTISSGHFNQPKVIQLIKVGSLPGFESQNRVYSEQGLAPNIRAKQQGLIQVGDSYNTKMPTSTTRRGRHGKQIAQSIETDCKQVVLTDNYRIRRYTPLECMRLMGYPDSFVKPCSETQTYKQAGNSIPVHMMKAILKQLLPILTA